jgi:putative DNA primase/helicase
LGTPARIWNYRDASGAVLTYVYRFESRNGAGKETRPLSYCRHGETGKTAWQWKALSTPRPLYALDRLAACPDATVIVVEGEKAADACQALFPAHVATTPPNGAQSPQCADWSPLAGRTVWLWPDQDAAGRGFAQAVGRLLLDAGATRVAVIEPDGFRWLPDGTERETLPEKWDAADALAEGFSIEDAARIAAGPGPRRGGPPDRVPASS